VCLLNGDCCSNACDTCGYCAECGNGSCEYGEDPCNCSDDCPNDPNACEACECGSSGGDCSCDWWCTWFGDCCANACDTCGYCPECGNGWCEQGEDPCSCPSDCSNDPDSCEACECGSYSENCWCDDKCVEFGDCCWNACIECGSCPTEPECGDGICQPSGGEDECNCPDDCPNDPDSCEACECGSSGGNCYCDDACVALGDCCADACSTCGYCA
jgi:hypothetical protein